MGLAGLESGKSYRLTAQIYDKTAKVKDFKSEPFTAADVKDGRFSFTGPWKPEKLWDTNTPQNTYEASVSLVDSSGPVADAFRPVRFGFREFWMDGRDFYLNGTRFFAFIEPIDNAQMGTASPPTMPAARPCSATGLWDQPPSTPTTTAASPART